MNQGEQDRKISQLIAKCWADEGFKQKALADPAATLRAEGVELPAGLLYMVHDNTDKVVHLVIPAKPTDLSDEALGNVVGGLMDSMDIAERNDPRSPPYKGYASSPAPTIYRTGFF
jgi:hypothetical protein